MNVYFKSSNPIEKQLSNLAYSPFIIDGRQCNSIEGFYQGIKRSGVDMQNHIFLMHGMKAKAMSKPTGGIFWNDEIIQPGSQEHHDLIFEAQKCKYSQHLPSREALIATGNNKITHNTGGKDSVFYPARVFTQHLTKIRSMIARGEL